MSEADDSTSSKEEKKETSSFMSDDEILKTLGPDVGNVYVQHDQEVHTIKQSLHKNLKLAQVNHIDQNLLKLSEDDDSASGDSLSESKKEESVKSISQVDSLDGAQAPLNLSQINYGPEGEPKPTDVKAFLVTGATHARELLSSQVPLYLCLKLIHQGYVQNVTKYANMLENNVFYFIPVINADGSALVERHWNEKKEIMNKRKNNKIELICCHDLFTFLMLAMFIPFQIDFVFFSDFFFLINI